MSRLLPTGTLAALRLYAARPSLRGNFWLLIGLGMLATNGFTIASLRHAIHAKGLVALYSHNGLTVWWMAAFYLAAALASIYWGRVASNIAPAQPNLLAAEHAAGGIAIVLLAALLATPLVVLGAAVPNALALTCLASVGGFGFGRGTAITGQSRRQQTLTSFLFLPLLFVGSLDAVVRAIGFAPPWVTWPLVITVLAAAIASLRFRPGHAARQEEHAAATAHLAAARPTGAGTQRLHRALAWLPPPLRDQPLPPGTFNPGTLGLALQVLAILLFGMAIAWVIHALSGDTHAHGAVRLLGSAVSVIVLSSSTWLLARGEWTRIFVAGRYGTRHRFARALIRAHLGRTAHMAVIGAAVLGVMLMVLHVAPPAHALRRAGIIALMLFAASQLGCLGAMASRLSKLWIGVGNFGGMMVVNLLAGALVAHDWPLFGYSIVASAAGASGLAVALLGPRGLIGADWTPDDSNG